MIFTTRVRKEDADFRSQHERVDGGERLSPHDPLTVRARRAAVKVATRRAVESFDGAELCPIRVVNFQEFGPRDEVVAVITLDIETLGDVHEVTGT